MSIPRHPGHFFRAACPFTPLHRSCYGAAIDPELNRPCSIAVELSLSRRRDATTTPYDRRTVFRCPFGRNCWPVSPGPCGLLLVRCRFRPIDYGAIGKAAFPFTRLRGRYGKDYRCHSTSDARSGEFWKRESDLNRRSGGYEPPEIPLLHPAVFGASHEAAPYNFMRDSMGLPDYRQAIGHGRN